jgi:probable rRNA maturation factor
VKVQVTCELAAGRSLTTALGTDARRLLREYRLRTAELSLVLTGDLAIRALNRRFRQHDRATDVLSFPQFEDPLAARLGAGSAPLPLGDIVISLETAARQAHRMGLSPADRMQMLLVHGFLHLLGFDHERSRRDARLMFGRERELIALLAGAPLSKVGAR